MGAIKLLKQLQSDVHFIYTHEPQNSEVGEGPHSPIKPSY